jgi:sphingolipid delta-4 desaturase
MHEVSHDLAFGGKLRWLNRYFGVFTNLPLGIPAFASFRRYHQDHHKYQGEDAIDTDIPTEGEISFFNSTALKLLWVFMQPGFYALRPMIVMPKIPTGRELFNIASQVAFDVAVFYLLGGKSLAYLVLGTLLGMGLHPMAGHFIAEHYTFIQGQETYSYYGVLNLFSFNVGYHNEHHDFPNIPGCRLPELRRLCPEFYDDALPYHDSWVKVIYKYITDPSIGPYSRIKRNNLGDDFKKDLRSR